MRHQRRGFTLIELLVVIGIMMLLVGVLVLGMRHLNKSMANKETISELHILRGMLTEYETHSGIKGIEETLISPTLGTADPTVVSGMPSRTFPVYIDSNSAGTVTYAYIRLPTDPTTIAGEGMQPAPQFTGGLFQFKFDLASDAQQTDMSSRSAGDARYSAASVKRTGDVMLVLLRVPANRNIVQSVQSKRILEVPPGGKPSLFTMDNYGAVLLDGWGDPIIFVPRGGIHVNIKDPANPSGTPNEYVVRSTGMFPASQLSTRPVLPADRPFFASAGQDGDFTLGEDNIYSFQD